MAHDVAREIFRLVQSGPPAPVPSFLHISSARSRKHIYWWLSHWKQVKIYGEYDDIIHQREPDIILQAPYDYVDGLNGLDMYAYMHGIELSSDIPLKFGWIPYHGYRKDDDNSIIHVMQARADPDAYFISVSRGRVTRRYSLDDLSWPTTSMPGLVHCQRPLRKVGRLYKIMEAVIDIPEPFIPGHYVLWYQDEPLVLQEVESLSQIFEKLISNGLGAVYFLRVSKQPFT